MLEETSRTDSRIEEPVAMPGLARMETNGEENSFAQWVQGFSQAPIKANRIALLVALVLMVPMAIHWMNTGVAPNAYVAVLLFVFTYAIAHIANAYGTDSIPTDADRKMLKEAGNGVVLVRAEFEIDGVIIGEDRGVLWAEAGRLMFNAHRTSFSIRMDSKKFGGGKFDPWFIRWFSPLRAGKVIHVNSGYRSYRIRVSALHKPNFRIQSKSVLDQVFALAARHGMESGGFSQFPPNTVASNYRDTKLVQAFLACLVSLPLAIGASVGIYIFRDEAFDSILKIAYCVGTFFNVWSFAINSSRELVGRLYGIQVRRKLRADAAPTLDEL